MASSLSSSKGQWICSHNLNAIDLNRFNWLTAANQHGLLSRGPFRYILIRNYIIHAQFTIPNNRIKFVVYNISQHVSCYTDRKFPKNKHLYLWYEPRRWRDMCLLWDDSTYVWLKSSQPRRFLVEVAKKYLWQFGGVVVSQFKCPGQHVTISFPDNPAFQ